VVALHLRAKGFDSFLPLYQSRRRWSDRIKELELPLFPGYVFCRFDPLNRLPVLSIPGVICAVAAGRTPLAIDEAEMVNIQLGTKQPGLRKRPWPFLQTGHRVRIERGPLCGVEGILLAHSGQERLVLSITLLKRSIAIEVEGDWVRPLQMETVFYPGLASS
jgi:transcription antitermination factor NusG